VSAATQVYYASFDAVFLKLPPPLRARVEAKIDDIGSQLGSFPHHRLKGSNRFRARVGDYRIIYAFERGVFNGRTQREPTNTNTLRLKKKSTSRCV
jgi:hypothetical protein